LVEGKNVFHAHTDPVQQKNVSAVHAQLWLSAEVWRAVEGGMCRRWPKMNNQLCVLRGQVLLQGDFKLLVAQQDPHKTQQAPIYGWKCGGISQPRCNTTNASSEP